METTELMPIVLVDDADMTVVEYVDSDWFYSDDLSAAYYPESDE